MTKWAIGRSFGVAMGVMIVSLLPEAAGPNSVALGSRADLQGSSVLAYAITVRPHHGPGGTMVHIHGTDWPGTWRCPLPVDFLDADGTYWPLEKILYQREFTVDREVPVDAAIGTGQFQVWPQQRTTTCKNMPFEPAEAPFKVRR